MNKTILKKILLIILIIILAVFLYMIINKAYNEKLKENIKDISWLRKNVDITEDFSIGSNVLSVNKLSEIDIYSDVYQKVINEKIKVDDYDNLYPLILNGYANGFLVKELIANEMNNNLLFEIPINLKTNNFKLGILYNVNNELKIKQYFDI